MPPPAAPSAWPTYIAELLSAIRAEAISGAAPPRRACWPELDEKQPIAQGTSTSAMPSSDWPSGHSSNPNAITASKTLTARPAPMRSMWRDSSTLTPTPITPNQKNSRLIWLALKPKPCR